MADDTPQIPEGLDWKAFTPDDSPKTPMDIFSDPVHRALATADLAVGDRCFDFDLPLADFSDGVERRTNETFHLLGAAEKRPVALIFGSYT